MQHYANCALQASRQRAYHQTIPQPVHSLATSFQQALFEAREEFIAMVHASHQHDMWLRELRDTPPLLVPVLCTWISSTRNLSNKESPFPSKPVSRATYLLTDGISLEQDDLIEEIRQTSCSGEAR